MHKFVNFRPTLISHTRSVDRRKTIILRETVGDFLLALLFYPTFHHLSVPLSGIFSISLHVLQDLLFRHIRQPWMQAAPSHDSGSKGRPSWHCWEEEHDLRILLMARHTTVSRSLKAVVCVPFPIFSNGEPAWSTWWSLKAFSYSPHGNDTLNSFHQNNVDPIIK